LIGQRIQKRRIELGLTQKELGKRAGLTAGYLSRLENDLISPSLDSLQAIATALEVPMFYFLDSTPPIPVVRAEERRRLYFPDSHMGYELLTPELTRQMMALLIRMEPGARRVALPLAKPNEQWMFVLQGELQMDVDGNIYTLRKGDSIYYNGNLLREFRSVGNEELLVVCCVVPPAL